MDRIKMDNLERLVTFINKIAGTPEQPWSTTDGGSIGDAIKYKANVGNYHLEGAYGGWRLCQMVNEGGGTRNVLSTGFVSKKELYNAMHAFKEGLLAEQAKVKV